jgi:hypothetical protein
MTKIEIARALISAMVLTGFSCVVLQLWLAPPGKLVRYTALSWAISWGLYAALVGLIVLYVKTFP